MKKVLSILMFFLLFENSNAESWLSVKLSNGSPKEEIRICKPINGIFNSNYASRKDRFIAIKNDVTATIKVEHAGFIALLGNSIEKNFRLYICNGDSVTVCIDGKKVLFKGTNAEGHEYYRSHQYQFYYTFLNGTKKATPIKDLLTACRDSLNKQIIDYKQMLNEKRITHYFFQNIVSEIYSDYYCYTFFAIIQQKASNNPKCPYTIENCQLAYKQAQELYDPFSSKNIATTHFLSNIRDLIKYANMLQLERDNLTSNGELITSNDIANGLDKLPNKWIEDVIGENLLSSLNFGLPLNDSYLTILKKKYHQSQYLSKIEELKAIQKEKVTLPSNVSTFIYCKKDQDRFIVENETSPQLCSIQELIIWLKGRKAFVDIWAPWCKPCIEEFKLQGQTSMILKMLGYTPVYISIDELSWTNRIVENNLSGYHISANNMLTADLKKVLETSTLAIPRYLIIGTNGQILSKDAPRPSSEEFFKTLSSIGKE